MIKVDIVPKWKVIIMHTHYTFNIRNKTHMVFVNIIINCKNIHIKSNFIIRSCITICLSVYKSELWFTISFLRRRQRCKATNVRCQYAKSGLIDTCICLWQDCASWNVLVILFDQPSHQRSIRNFRYKVKFNFW